MLSDGWRKKIYIETLDLHPTRVFKQDNDSSWIEQAIENLRAEL
jgi:hypothetical protein